MPPTTCSLLPFLCDTPGYQWHDNVVDDVTCEGFVEFAAYHHLAEYLSLDDLMHQARQLAAGVGRQFAPGHCAADDRRGYRVLGEYRSQGLGESGVRTHGVD